MVQNPPSMVHKPQDNVISDIAPSLYPEWCPGSFVPPTRRSMVHRQAAATAALALLSVVAVAACTDSEPPVTPSAAPSLAAPPNAAASPSASAETLALNAYSGMWGAYAKAGLTANRDEPDLAIYAAGDALEVLQRGLAATRKKGQVFKGEYVSKPTVADVIPQDSPTSVLIADCIDMTKFLVYRTNGELADGKPGGRRSAGATVRLHGGTWKVINFGLRERGTC